MRSSLTSFTTLSTSLNLSGLLSLQAWPSPPLLTGESIKGADLDDGALRNTGLPRGVRRSCLEDAGSASPDASLVRKVRALQGRRSLMIPNPAQVGQGEQGFILSVSSTMMRLWFIWVCWGLWLLVLKTHWCVNLMFCLPSFSCVSKRWKDPPGQALSPAGHSQRGRTLLPLLA